MNGSNNGANGTSNHHEDHGGSDPMELTSLGLNRNELVRIIVQAIDALGYSKSARCLEEDAGVESMSPQMRTLRDCVLRGRWDSLEDVLDSLNVFKTEADARAARFVLYEQKFLELLEAGRTAEALDCLRNHLTRLSPDPKLLQKLPLLCMCASPDEVRDHASWPGAGKESRTAVLEKLHRYIPPTQLLQENRLEKLLCQTIDQQKRLTMFPYTRQRTVSLLEDMEHCQDRVPRDNLCTLEGHTDEVWFVEFSHSGEFLASASKDATVLIWRVRDVLEKKCTPQEAVKFTLKGHSQMIGFLSWSPDDRFLLSCGNDRSVRLWDMATGAFVRSFEKHIDQVTAVAWMPNGKHFVSGGHDSRILEWDAESGECMATYAASSRVNDLAVSTHPERVIATCCDKEIQVFDSSTKAELYSLRETVSITSIFLSPDGDSLLVNTNSNEDPDQPEPEVHIWSLRDRRVTQTYKGFKQDRYVIRGCFGGYSQMLVLCGSEDKLVYIWERSSGGLVAVLAGHEGTVNTVACSAADENLLASGSDDKTVIVWGVSAHNSSQEPSSVNYGSVG